MKTLEYAAIIALILMLLDIISGFLNACESNTVSSSKMRIGLFHKAAEIMLMFLAALADWAQQIKIIQFSDTTVPVALSTCIFIIVMEFVSILENLVSMFPSLKDAPIFSIFTNNYDTIKKINTTLDANSEKIADSKNPPKHTAPTITDSAGQGDSMPPNIIS
jgi:toxin secretion/phage lysis holin